MAKLDEIFLATREEWRSWLEANHRTSRGVWLVFNKKHTGRRSPSYEDSVLEALCFGWVDSLVKRLDADRYARKFTPRKEGSVWSDTNRRRFAELESSGLLARAGIERSPTLDTYPPIRGDGDIPAELSMALDRNPRARAAWTGLAPSHRRAYSGWLASAKRPETRQRRAAEIVRCLRTGKALGMK